MAPSAIVPGVHDLSAAVYHADPCPTPSLSASIASILIGQSPRHAWTAHPRLNPRHEPEHKTAFDIGHAAHQLMLGQVESFDVLLFDDYRKKAAQEARDAAYARGAVPILAHEMANLRVAATAWRAQLDAHQDAAGAFKNGKAEQTLIWRDGDVWCRSMFDWWPDAGSTFDDFKTTTASAHPDAVGNRIWNTGADFQSAFYKRGLRAHGIKSPRFRFVVAELDPPHALSVVELDPGADDLADHKVEEAIALWSRCMATDTWPGYPSRTCFISAPAWEMNRAVERENRRHFLRDEGKSELATLTDWQRPL